MGFEYELIRKGDAVAPSSARRCGDPPPLSAVASFAAPEGHDAPKFDVAVSFSRRDDASSAKSVPTIGQLVGLSSIAVAMVAAAVVAPSSTVFLTALIATVTFATLTVLRLYALYVVVRRMGPAASSSMPSTTVDIHQAGVELPTYSVLVTLYDEAAVVPGLLASLAALDYPPDRLEVLLLLEAHDYVTLQAIAAVGVPPHVRVLVVPDGAPRTKPRALCYGLARSTGEYVTVFDAEDRPEPDQLRKAVTIFGASDPSLGCLQARLNIYNRRQSLVTRLFTVEYTTLFDGTLPALVAAGSPIPLGGTSNHFPRRALERAASWDPWNVTEDADLGVRLARLGYRVEALSSTTWEEAPTTSAVWFRQRTRWQKGWIQTYLVHMRDPVSLLRDLGWWRFLWFQALFGGGLLAALTHPWMIMSAVVMAVWRSQAEIMPAQSGFDTSARTAPLADALWTIGLANLIIAALLSATVALVTIRRRGFDGLAAPAVAAPLLWLPVALAAYAALVELLVRPFHWAKTPHGLVRREEA